MRYHKQLQQQQMRLYQKHLQQQRKLHNQQIYVQGTITTGLVHNIYNNSTSKINLYNYCIFESDNKSLSEQLCSIKAIIDIFFLCKIVCVEEKKKAIKEIYQWKYIFEKSEEKNS